MIINPRPKLELVDADAIDRIHEASCQILEEVGIVFTLDEALDILEGTPGTRVDRDEKRVFIDRSLVEHSLGLCPGQVTIRARNPRKSVTLGGDCTCFGTSSGPPFAHDRIRGRRLSTLADMVELVKIVHCLPQIDMALGGGSVEPQDIEVELRALARSYSAAKFTDKPTSLHGFWGKLSAEDGLAIARIVHDGVDIAKEPVGFCNVNPISPLLWDERMTEAIIAHARARQPVIFAPAVMGGITGPMTLAGSMAQQNAEVLAGIVLAQAVSPGTPCLLGCVTTVGDMKVGAPAYGSPESAICLVVAAQLARKYGIPCRGGGALTDSKLPDIQAGIERMLTTLITVQCGMNLALHGGGMLESFLTTSYELLVIDDDVIGMVKRFVEGMKVDEAEIALDVIKEVGPQGMFLTTEHTYTHFKGAYFEPRLADRQIYAEWVKRGSKSAEERATERWQQILATYEPPELEPAKEREIQALIRSRPGGDAVVDAILNLAKTTA